MNLPFDPVEISRRLLAWYGREGRVLPWRQTREPYRIWLSEIMLQQTTVAAVIPYYERFLTRFPVVQDLAEADLDEVLGLWAGLGYYSRARNLHKAARVVVNQYDGAFPATLEGLMALPGVGRSTAGAILSIAFDQPAPILDGNVRRVLVRLFAWTDDPRSRAAEQQLWQWAAMLTSEQQPHDYAQAIMDLGATVCTPRQPTCGRCPLQAFCQAWLLGLAASLPVKRKKRDIPARRQVALLINSTMGLLVRQRPPNGLLGGMWEFPVTDLAAGFSAAERAREFAAEVADSTSVIGFGTIHHAYSHFKLELALFSLRLDDEERCALAAGRWCAAAELATLPLHGAHRKAYELFQDMTAPQSRNGSACGTKPV